MCVSSVLNKNTAGASRPVFRLLDLLVGIRRVHFRAQERSTHEWYYSGANEESREAEEDFIGTLSDQPRQSSTMTDSVVRRQGSVAKEDGSRMPVSRSDVGDDSILIGRERETKPSLRLLNLARLLCPCILRMACPTRVLQSTSALYRSADSA
jgi:hypothetical protein